MNITRRSWVALVALATLTVSLPRPAFAQTGQDGDVSYQWSGEDRGGVIAADATRYMALGDSIAAGYKAVPVTNAYPYLLYRKGSST
jgi:hypothetical protein